MPRSKPVGVEVFPMTWADVGQPLAVWGEARTKQGELVTLKRARPGKDVVLSFDLIGDITIRVDFGKDGAKEREMKFSITMPIDGVLTRVEIRVWRAGYVSMTAKEWD